MQINPYLNFNGRCEEALNFYRDALGAQVTSMFRFSEAPDKEMIPPGGENKVMHASLRIGDSDVMASDGECAPGKGFEGIALSIGVASVEAGEKVFKALSQGGKVRMEFAPTFWTAGFGQLTDRFGVEWMVNVNHEPA